jgi:hypothetical protein
MRFQVGAVRIQGTPRCQAWGNAAAALLLQLLAACYASWQAVFDFSLPSDSTGHGERSAHAAQPGHLRYPVPCSTRTHPAVWFSWHLNNFLAVRCCSTCSEVVVPVLMGEGRQCAAVLDVDSDLPAAFDTTDQQYLEELCAWMSGKYFNGA